MRKTSLLLITYTHLRKNLLLLFSANCRHSDFAATGSALY